MRNASDSGGGAASVHHVALASTVGAVIEWYDFFLFATMAALVFNTEFFPAADPVTGTLAAYATFASGFVTRPIGGLLFGHFGDRMGRKRMLVVTMMIMGGATFAMGLLPGYQEIGIWAPVLLLILRMLQGIGLGGEWGGAAILAFEHAPRHRRGLFASWPQTGVPIGLLLSTAAVGGAGLFGDEALQSWAWRIPFLFSILLVAVGLFIRLRVSESATFHELVDRGEQAKVPARDVLRDHLKVTALAMGARFCESVTFNIYNTFILAYTTQVLGLPKNIALNGLLIAAVVGFMVIPATGWLSDRIGRRPVYLAGAAVSGISAFPVFGMIDSADTTLVWAGIIIGWAIAACAMYGPQSSYFAELFPARVRYTGMSIVYQFGVLPSGAIAPIVGIELVRLSDGASWPVALYVLVVAVIAVVSLFFAPETFRRDADERTSAAAPPAERTAPTGSP